MGCMAARKILAALSGCGQGAEHVTAKIDGILVSNNTSFPPMIVLVSRLLKRCTRRHEGETMQRPQTIQIFLPLGDPSAIRQAEITTRTVRVFEVPRPMLQTFRSMPESSQVGLYFLFGGGTEDLPECYIGQTGNVGARLAEHAVKKDFWDRALVAVSLTNTWTDTHVGYMEYRAIDMATSAGRYALKNGNAASNRHTPTPLEADCHEFLDTISVLLSTLGKPVLQAPRALEPNSHLAVTDQDVRFFLNAAGTRAEAVRTAEGMLVRAGSYGNAAFRPSAVASLHSRRHDLIEAGIAANQGERFVLLKDHLFSSPSGAGDVLVGGSINGRKEWKNARGQSIKDLEEGSYAVIQQALDNV